MKNRTLTFLLLLFLVPVLVSAQQRSIMKKAPSIMDKPSTVLEKNYTPGGKLLDIGSYIPVDTMSNGFSYAITGLTPLYFDPFSGALGLVHRGWAGGHYAAGSGEIWYNTSTDFGVSWSRVPVGVNSTNSQIFGRYPNMTISNPTKGDISKTTGFFVWPELNPGAFGFMGYAADQPFGAGSPAAFLDETGNDYSTSMMAWADDQTPEIFWVAPFQTYANLKLFKTSDFATIDTVSPPQWSDSVFQDNGNIGIGSTSFNGVEYVGEIGPFDTTLVPDPPTGGWLVGYSKSTDKGATWSSFNIADFRKIPRLANYDELFDFKKGDIYISYQGSMGVDKNNHVHILVSVTDTTTDRDHGTNSIVDIFETGSGWDGTVVFSGLDTAYSQGPGLGQVGPSTELAFDTSHTVMAVQFINTPAPGKWNDLFLTYKGINDTSWSTPVNLTNSADSINNTSAHMAPYLQTSGVDQYTAFSGFCYSPAPFLPTYDANTTGVLYVAPYTFNYTATGINDPVAAVNSFSLLQNYPNPFNPSTLIKYTLAQKNNVSLKIFDVLGREVANLVNESQEAGSHSVNFNASKLASGMYIYTLRAGNNSVSKKMMLLK